VAAENCAMLECLRRGLGLLVVISAACLPGAAAAATMPDSLTVEDCVALARSRAPEVLLASGLEASARADSFAVAYNGRPEFFFLASAYVAPRGFYDPVITNLGEYRLQLGMKVPLLDGGARARERTRAGYSTASSALDRAQAARESGRRAALLGLTILKQQENERTQAEMLTWLERLAANIASGVRGGARSRADATRADLESARVRSALVEVRLEIAALGRELGELIGLPAGDVPRLRESVASPDTGPSPADSARLLAAVSDLPGVRRAQIEAAQEQLAVRDAEHRHAFELGLVADAGFAGAGLTSAVSEGLRLSDPDATFADRLRQDLGASVALELRRPILDAAQPHVLAARARGYDAAIARADQAANRARREALDVLARWRAAAGRVGVESASTESADENLLRLRSMYAGGGAALLELLDARQQLDEARARLAEARFEARAARYDAELP
jgi:outer membrane protein TolC